jgi:hypothetical protein
MDRTRCRVLHIILIMFFVLFPNSSWAVDFDKLGGTMVIYGEIEKGDYQRFIKEYLTWKNPPTIFAFDSIGGNVVDAMAIGVFVRNSRIPVWVTGKCFSACAFIYLAAPSRQATGEIGLHRPYFDQTYFAGLTSYEAEKEYKVLERITASYLDDVGVDKQLQDIIRSVPSNKMRIFRGREETSIALGDESIFMEEWKIAKCGSLERSAVVPFCAYTYLEYIYLNLNLVKGWRQTILENPISPYRQNMPSLCQEVMKEVQSLAYQTIDSQPLFEILKSQSEPITLREECISRAEHSEVRSFFYLLKGSKEATMQFLKPAIEILHDRYGK